MVNGIQASQGSSQMVPLSSSRSVSNVGASADVNRSSAGSRTDEVAISREARLMQVAQEAVEGSTGVRPEVVAYYRNQIASGKYQVDSSKIALGIQGVLG